MVLSVINSAEHTISSHHIEFYRSISFFALTLHKKHTKDIIRGHAKQWSQRRMPTTLYVSAGSSNGDRGTSYIDLTNCLRCIIQGTQSNTAPNSHSRA
jgi:hypothetical protein